MEPTSIPLTFESILQVFISMEWTPVSIMVLQIRSCISTLLGHGYISINFRGSTWSSDRTCYLGCQPAMPVLWHTGSEAETSTSKWQCWYYYVQIPNYEWEESNLLSFILPNIQLNVSGSFIFKHRPKVILNTAADPGHLFFWVEQGGWGRSHWYIYPEVYLGS